MLDLNLTLSIQALSLADEMNCTAEEWDTGRVGKKKKKEKEYLIG